MFDSKGLDASCAHGAYWEIISVPKDVEWDFVRFNEKDSDILNPHYLIPGQIEFTLPKVDEEK